MEIGRAGAMGSQAVSQIGIQTQTVDSVSKGIEKEIAGVQRQMKSLSSKEELSVEEKTQKRQELQKEMSKLNTQLRQHQAEASKEQRRKEAQKGSAGTEKESKENNKELSGKGASAREATGKEVTGKEAVNQNITNTENKLSGRDTTGREAAKSGLQEDDSKKRAQKDEERTDASSRVSEEQAIYAAGSAIEQVKNQGAVIARIDGGIAVLKGEISQDENRGMNVDKKKEELEKQEKRAQRAADFRKSVIEEAKREMRPTQSKTGKQTEGRGKSRDDTDGRVFLKGMNFSQNNQQEMQNINISIT